MFLSYRMGQLQHSQKHYFMERLKGLQLQKSTHRREVIFRGAGLPGGERYKHIVDCRVVGQVGKVIL